MIVGDKLNKQEEVLNSIKNFKLTQPLGEVYEGLTNTLKKVEAKGQTAMGPAIISAIEIAAKGSPGSMVTLCTDGLSNLGVGSLEEVTEDKIKLYEEIAEYAKSKNIVINIMSIKGEGCKLEVIGKLAELTNGNLEILNPEKLSE